MSTVKTEKGSSKTDTEDLLRDALYITRKIEERLKKEKRHPYQNWLISTVYADEGLVRFSYEDGHEVVDISLKVYNKARGKSYEATITYLGEESRMIQNEEYEKYPLEMEKTISIKDYYDTTINIHWAISKRPVTKPKKEKFLLTFFKYMKIEIDTSDLNYFIGLLRNYGILIDFIHLTYLNR